MDEIEVIQRSETGRFLKGNTVSKKPHKKWGYHLTELLKEEGDIPDTLLPEKTKLQRVIETLYNDAIAGNMRAIEIIFERLYGKEPDVLQLGLEEQLDLGKLSDSELVEYNQLLEKLENDKSKQD